MEALNKSNFFRSFAKKWSGNWNKMQGQITIFFKMREITMCQLAGGNGPVERERSDGAGE